MNDDTSKPMGQRSGRDEEEQRKRGNKGGQAGRDEDQVNNQPGAQHDEIGRLEEPDYQTG